MKAPTTLLVILIIIIAGIILLPKSKTEAPITQTPTTYTSSWEGKYQFDETATNPNGLQNVWSYKLNIYKEAGKLKAHLNVDGYQTMTDINASVNVIGSKIEIVFDSYGPDNRFTPYKKGDVLFTLTPAEITDDPTDLGINWNEIQPQLVENKMRSAFVKVTD